MTIVGSGFTGASSVSIGGVAATGVTVINDSMINCTTGTHAAGTVDVVVGALTRPGLYTYDGSAPVPAGASWTRRGSTGGRDWSSITCSADGTKLAAAVGVVYFGVSVGVDFGHIWTSTDGGVSWKIRSGPASRAWRCITCSADGSKLAAVVGGFSSTDGYIWTSTDSGANWTRRISAGNRDWRGIACSADGSKLAAGVSGGAIWTSTDGGVTWTERSSTDSRYWWY